jgi:hypothetical protein
LWLSEETYEEVSFEELLEDAKLLALTHIVGNA